MNIASECPVTGTRYDFSKLEDRSRAVSRLCSERPYVLITSPMCTKPFKPASLNLKSKGVSHREQTTQKAREYLEFICKLIMIQHRNKRYFIHEHCGDTSSWHDQCVQGVLAVTQATVSKFDQCQFGSLDADNIGSTKHYRKCSKLITKIPPSTQYLVAICARKNMNTFDPQEVKHVMRKPARFSCAKPSCQRSNSSRRNGMHVDSNCWRLLRQRERHQQEAMTYQRRSRQMRFWRPGTTPLEKTLIRSLSWRPDEKKSHTTKQWCLSRRSRYHNVLPEPDASQSGTMERHQQGRSVQRHCSQQTGGKGIQQQEV